MRQRLINITVELFIILGALVIASGCQKKCQAPPTDPLKTIVDQEFRLVETTDPNLASNLNNVNFITMIFKIDYVGQVYTITNNDKANTPSRVFRYKVDPTQNLLTVQYYKVPDTSGSGGSGGGNSTDPQAGNEVGGVKTYSYSLGVQLEMQDLNGGYYYRFVPFQGVVRPDEVCTF